MSYGFTNSTAVQATLHCLTGCAIGEVLGLIIGTAAHWNNFVTAVVSIVLAFIFGYALSTRTIHESGLSWRSALKIALAADTLSITTMELTDTLVVLVIPGAVTAGLGNAVFWIAMIVSLTAAFFAALPVNNYLIKRGRGHALAHAHHH
jgi:hypothetical protein